ncbi:hypothetical protein ACJX0J_031618, partial [Zea mays]
TTKWGLAQSITFIYKYKYIYVLIEGHVGKVVSPQHKYTGSLWITSITFWLEDEFTITKYKLLITLLFINHQKSKSLNWGLYYGVNGLAFAYFYVNYMGIPMIYMLLVWLSVVMKIKPKLVVCINLSCDTRKHNIVDSNFYDCFLFVICFEG